MSLLNGLICFGGLTRFDFGDAFCNGERLLCTGLHAEVFDNSVVSKLERDRYLILGGVCGIVGRRSRVNNVCCYMLLIKSYLLYN